MIRRLNAVFCVLLLVIACAEAQDPLEGPLRVRALPDAGDTLRRLVEGTPDGVRLVRPAPELSINSSDSAGEEPLAHVRSVIGQQDGSTLVYDERQARIALFDPSGRLVTLVGRTGRGPGEYGTPYGMAALPGDRFVLWDGTGARLNVYGSDGRFLWMWPVASTGVSSADGLVSDAAGRIYLRAMLRYDAAAPERSITGVVRWDSLGGGDSIPFPHWNGPAQTLVARTPSGMTVSGGSFPYLPRDYHRITATGDLVTGPGVPYELVFLSQSGAQPVRISRAYRPVPIAARERESLRARIEREMRGIDAAWTWNGPPIPLAKPAYRGIETDREGRIWVLISMPTLEVPQRELPAYDVYAPDGAPIARVELARGARFAAATRDYLWTVRLDSLDVPTVERARLELPAPLRP